MSAWGAGILLLAFATVTLLLTRESVSGRLVELLRERDSTVDEVALQGASTRIVLALLGAVVVTTILAGLVLRAFNRRRRWPRMLMLPVSLLAVVVASLAGLVVPTTGWQGWMLLGSLALGVVCFLFGSVSAMGRGVRTWLREPRREHLPDSG